MKKGTLRIGICGAGNRGVYAFGALFGQRKDCRVAALCDTNAVRLRDAASLVGGDPACYGSLGEMLARERLDAVTVATPDALHAEHACAALREGVHVLIDKPLATTVDGCRRILRASWRSGKVAMVGFNLRHVATIRRLKEIVDDGVLGRVFLIENREFYKGGRTYLSRWNRKYALSGGLWVHKGSHDFDLFNWILGFPKPARVAAFAGVNVFTPEHLPFKLRKGVPAGPTCAECAYAKVCPDCYDLAQSAAHATRVIFGKERSGIRGLDEPSWGRDARAVDGYAKDLCMYLSDKDTHDNGIALVEYENGARASHLECFVTNLSDRLYTLVGEKGQAEASLAQRTITIRPRWKGKSVTYRVPEESGGHGGSDPRLVDAFVKAGRGKSDISSTLEHGLLSTAIGQDSRRHAVGDTPAYW